MNAATPNDDLQLQVRALDLSERLLGSCHPGTAKALRDVANSYTVHGLPELAKPLQSRARAIEKGLPDSVLLRGGGEDDKGV